MFWLGLGDTQILYKEIEMIVSQCKKIFRNIQKRIFFLQYLEVDSKYENKDLRKQRETFLIEQIPEELRYNQLEAPEYSKSRGIQIRGQVYQMLPKFCKNQEQIFFEKLQIQKI